MTPLWTAAEAAVATSGQATSDWAVSGISIDSRSIRTGEMFVALRDVRDGHDYVAEALKRGAGAAMVSRMPEGLAPDAPLLIVDDVLEGLQALGRAGRARSGAKVVAVTGSVGKTSTKEMLRVVLDRQGSVHAAEKSFNNHWGVPITLARLPRDADFAVIEIGMNHPGEIAPLAALARPHVALVTNVAAVHLEAFDGVGEIAQEKASIFGGLEPGGVAVFNVDVETADILSDAAQTAGRVVTFGQTEGAEFRLEQVALRDEATVATCHHGTESVLFKVKSPGRHFALNAVGVLAVVDVLGCDLALAACDLANWQPPAGRGTRETIVLDIVDEHLSFGLLDDAFNANPASLGAALDVLAASHPRDDIGRVAGGRRIAVLGDMLELGPQEIALHRDIANHPAFASIDVVHCVGDRMAALYEVLAPEIRGEWHQKAEDMAARAHAIPDAGDVVLVKGSKGSRVSLVVDAMRKLGHPQENNDNRGTG